MTLSSNKKTLVVVVEEVSGTTPSGNPLESAANAKTLVIDPQVTPDLEVEESNAVNDSFTPLRSTIGRKTVQKTFGVEIKGTKLGTFAAGAPDWAKLLQACMFKQVSGDLLALDGAFDATKPASGTGAAPFRHGETILGLTSGETAIVVHDTHDGATEMVIHSASGTFTDGETIQGQSTGSEVDLASSSAHSADKHYSWWPVSGVRKSVAVSSLAADVDKGTLLRGQTSGASGIVTETASTGATVIYYRPAGGNFDGSEDLDRIGPGSPATGVATTTADPVFVQGHTVSTRIYEDGRTTTGVGMQGNVSIDMEVSKPWTLNFDLRGGYVDSTDRPEITGIDYDYRVPPGWEDALCNIATNEDATYDSVADEVSVCINTMSIDLGNSLTDRLCANAAGGVAGTNITERAGTISFDPEATYESEFPWAGNLFAGNVSRFITTLGSSDGNRFRASMPGIQFTQAPHGDRDGTLIIDAQGSLTGGNNWNLDGPSVGISSTGGDNEFVLTYYTA